MTVTLSFIGGAGWQFFDNNGVPLAGGKIYTYAAGTTTPLTTYTARDGLTPNANPIILDAAGRTPQQIWSTYGDLYKYVVTTSADVLIRTWDNIGGIEIADDLQSNLANTTDNALGDNLVGFKQANAAGFLTGAVARTVSTKLQEIVSAKDFGAVGDGVTDDTAALKAAFDYAIPAAVAVELAGTYLVSGPIQPYVSRLDGEMHIICRGQVNIVVSSAASSFRDLLYFHTSTDNSGSITGGQLNIECNSLVASAITFRHDGTSQSGTVNITCPVFIRNCRNNDGAATYENQAFLVFGDYKTVVINDMRVEGVTRVASGGACKGISVAAFTGNVTINQPYVANVLTGAGTADADGIATFGKSIGATYAARGGLVNINEPVFVDCQGRSFKSQCSDTTVFRPRVYRKNVVSISQSADFDFQLGGQSLIVEPYYEYRLNGGTSPLGSSFSSVVFQQSLDDAQNVAKSIGGVLRTEVLVPRYCAAVYQPTALSGYVEISNLVVEPVGALTTTAISRAIIEIDANAVEAKSSKTTLVVRGCRGPIGSYAIGYVSYGGLPLTSKLTFEATDNYNTIATPIYRPFSNLSGAVITAVEKFVLRNNYGFISLMPGGWTFDFNNLASGNFFTVDIASVSATNAPGWGATGFAFIESMDQWSTSSNFQHVRVTVNNAAVANTVFFTQGGATPTWGTIK
jgi:hypothetical protein